MLELRGVNKFYGKGEAKVKALNNIDLKINDGEFVAIIGPSGSGKSTLLNILGGIDKVSDGDYLINNCNVSNYSDKQMAVLRNNEFGFILQYFGLINDYTVQENILLPLKYSKIKNKDGKKISYELLSKLDIEKKKNSYPTELSGGQCQRVAIARALVTNPEVILADEPTGALDKANGQEVIKLLEELNDEGKTVIIVSHDEKIYSRCDRIIKIQDGCIIDDKEALN